LKGETPEQGAIRELKEETGIEIKDSDLNFVCSCIYEYASTIYKCSVVFIDKEKTKIQLQEDETVDYYYLHIADNEGTYDQQKKRFQGQQSDEI